MEWIIFTILVILLFGSAKYHRYFYSLGTFFIIVVTGFRYKISYDYDGYTEIYNNDLFYKIKEPIWEKIIFLMKNLHLDSQSFFLLTSFIIYIGIFSLYRYKNEKSHISAMIFFLYPPLYWSSTNVLRQWVAISIIALSYKYLKEKKRIIFILSVFFASIFHKPSLVCFAFLFLNFNFKKVHLLLIFSLGYIMINYGLLNTLMSIISEHIPSLDKYIKYLFIDKYLVRSSGIGHIFLVTVIFSLILFKDKLLYDEDRREYNISLIGLYALFFFYENTAVRRIGIYFLVYLPLIIGKFYSSQNKLFNLFTKGLIMIYFILFWRTIISESLEQNYLRKEKVQVEKISSLENKILMFNFKILK